MALQSLMHYARMQQGVGSVVGNLNYAGGVGNLEYMSPHARVALLRRPWLAS